MTQLDDDLELSEVIGNLRIDSILGQGAMGIVYLAAHRMLGMPFVIKRMTDTDDFDVVLEEARLAARVRSPNVVEVTDVGMYKARPFIVQRYIDGIDLEELILSSEEAALRIPPRFMCRIIADVARGLHRIHQAGIVHRDIKPQNLFLDGYGTAMVGDFGVAFDPRETHSIEAAGTPLYMAPELWDGFAGDRRSDIYSLGATIHHLVTGEPPFDQRSMKRLGRSHLEEIYEAPATDDPVEAFLLSVVQRMLEKSAETRHQTAMEVSKQLEVVQGGRPQVRSRGDTWRIRPLTVKLRIANIAKVKADVIVNAANQWLTMDAGVALELLRVGGRSLDRAVREHAPAGMGDVIWTRAGKLKAFEVAHAVAALDGAICIQRCVFRALLGAEARGYETIAFPALGAGVGGVPMQYCAMLLLETVKTFAALDPQTLRTIHIVLHDEYAYEQWVEVISAM